MGYLTLSQTYDPKENDEDNFNMTQYNTSYNYKRRRCYYSNIVGVFIVDAITGENYPWRVGSKDESRFFKVTNTVNDYNYQSRDSRKAFYDSPYAYMNHNRIELDNEFLNNWYEKMETLYPGQYIKPSLS